MYPGQEAHHRALHFVTSAVTAPLQNKLRGNRNLQHSCSSVAPPPTFTLYFQGPLMFVCFFFFILSNSSPHIFCLYCQIHLHNYVRTDVTTARKQAHPSSQSTPRPKHQTNNSLQPHKTFRTAPSPARTTKSLLALTSLTCILNTARSALTCCLATISTMLTPCQPQHTAWSLKEGRHPCLVIADQAHLGAPSPCFSSHRPATAIMRSA